MISRDGQNKHHSLNPGQHHLEERKQPGVPSFVHACYIHRHATKVNPENPSTSRAENLNIHLHVAKP